MSEKREIKVLLVEDSAVEQRLMRYLIDNDPQLQLVASVANGKEAVEAVKTFSPDVVSMDIVMPVMDGIEATRIIMQECPVPIVIVSSIYQSSDIDMAIKELEAGAVTIIPKPFGPGHIRHNISVKKYISTLKLMSEIKVVRRRPSTTSSNRVADSREDSKIIAATQISPGATPPASFKKCRLIAIGASAGGPEGIKKILSSIDSRPSVPIIIIQHIDSNFTEGFCSWLNSNSNIPVKIFKNGDKIIPGVAYLAPPGNHLKFIGYENLTAIKSSMDESIVPSIDILFESIAEHYKQDCMAILLSGMGRDGAQGLKHIRETGGYTIIQNESSSLIFGMNGEAAKLGAACKEGDPAAIANEINKVLNIYPQND